jgi:hypothetical protein
LFFGQHTLKEFGMSRKWLQFGMLLAVLLFFTVLIVVRVEIRANDDVFIYFNYARNVVQGNWFAYDPRGIPSEGFTSLLFLLMLAPFEAAKINLLFASITINLAFIWIMAILAALICQQIGLIKHWWLLLFISCFLLFVAMDTNILYNLGSGLETVIGGSSIFAVIGMLSFALHATKHDKRYIALFYVAGFCAFLIRPENVLIAVVGSVCLLVFAKSRGAVLRYGIAFCLVFLAYLLTIR